MLKNLLSLAVISVLMAGCASPEARARIAAERKQVIDNWRTSISNTVVSCEGEKQCAKAFSLAKSYVSDVSDMKVQSSDDSMIATYNPNDWGLVGAVARKNLGKGESAEITFDSYCKGFRGERSINEDVTGFATNCARKLAMINNGFKSFIESRLN